jgi:competence protein ComEC
MPIFEKYGRGLSKFAGLIYEGLGVTVSAQILTTPLILARFSRLSLVAPVTNIIFLPLVPLIMFFAFAALALSFIFCPLFVLAGGAGFVLCDIMLKGVALFAAAPFASMTITSFPFWMMLAYYVLIAAAIIFFRKPRWGPYSLQGLFLRGAQASSFRPEKRMK